jgi:hypothetical protein
MNKVIQPKVKVKLVQSEIFNVTVGSMQCDLLWNQGKPRKTLIEWASRRTFQMQTDF